MSNGRHTESEEFHRFAVFRVGFPAFAFVLGVTAMAGWVFQQPHWRSLLPSGSEMKPNTALALMLLSSAVLLRAWTPGRKDFLRVANLLAIIAGLVAAVTLAEYFAGLNFGIDEMLFKDVPNPIGTSRPGRMAEPTAWSFLFGMMAVLLVDFETRRGLRPSHWFALSMSVIPGGILVCYVYGNMNVLALGSRTSYMAVPTAAAFIATALAILLQAPDRGLMRPLTARNQAGRVFRRLLVALLVLPPILGWIVLVFFKGRQNPPEFGVSATVMLSVLILAVLAWLSAASLIRSEETISAREESLRASEAEFRAFFELASIGAVQVDAGTSKFIRVNRRFCEITGYSAAELLELDVQSITHPEDREADRAKLAPVLRGEAPEYKNEKRYVRKDGQIIWVHVTAVAIRDAQGIPRRSAAVVLDITARKQAEAALRESEDRFRTMANTLPQLAWIALSDGYIFWYNLRWYEYTGTTPQQMEGWGWQAVHDEAALPKVLERWRASITTGQPFEMEFPLRGADGCFRPFLTRVVPLKNQEGRVTFWFGTNTDITDIVHARETLTRSRAELENLVAERTAQLREANENLQTFSYSAAHDLRAPLRAIHDFSSAVLTDFASTLDPTAKSYLVRVTRSAEQMRRLLADLLDYSKISGAELQLESVNLQTAVRDALALLETDIRAKNAVITVPSSLPAVLAHPATVTLLIQNLVSNALKFVPIGTQPQIRIAAESGPGRSMPNGKSPAGHGAELSTRTGPHSTDFVRLSVEDNGIGIAAKDLQNLFTTFHRLHGKEAYPGTGLGLAMVRKGAERMGGRVGVQSEPDKGSHFWIDLRRVNLQISSPETDGRSENTNEQSAFTLARQVDVAPAADTGVGLRRALESRLAGKL